MKYENIKYDSLVNFNVSFTTEIEQLNLTTDDCTEPLIAQIKQFK